MTTGISFVLQKRDKIFIFLISCTHGKPACHLAHPLIHTPTELVYNPSVLNIVFNIMVFISFVSQKREKNSRFL